MRQQQRGCPFVSRFRQTFAQSEAVTLTPNPYASPNEKAALPALTELTDEELSKLLTDEASSRHEVFGDVADIKSATIRYEGVQVTDLSSIIESILIVETAGW